MFLFNIWHRDVLAYPLIYRDSNYTSFLTKAELVTLWSKPFYPMVPFIMERMNRAFFTGK